MWRHVSKVSVYLKFSKLLVCTSAIQGSNCVMTELSVINLLKLKLDNGLYLRDSNGTYTFLTFKLIIDNVAFVQKVFNMLDVQNGLGDCYFTVKSACSIS